jgi:hypothetical protein
MTDKGWRLERGEQCGASAGSGRFQPKNLRRYPEGQTVDGTWIFCKKWAMILKGAEVPVFEEISLSRLTNGEDCLTFRSEV